MFLLPLAVAFAGYQLTWYGFSLLKGPGMGFLDLLLPSRIAHAEQIMDDWSDQSPDTAGIDPARGGSPLTRVLPNDPARRS